MAAKLRSKRRLVEISPLTKEKEKVIIILDKVVLFTSPTPQKIL